MPTTYLPRRAPSTSELTVRGVRCHLTHWPGRDPRPIVLLHGFMDTGDTFQFFVDAMPDEYSFVASDWRGFGRSGRQGDAYWFADYFADLDALLAVLSPDEPVTLIGHSMGGNVAMFYAGLCPERVRAVVDIEGFGLARTRPEQAPDRYRDWLKQLRRPPPDPVYASAEVLAQALQRRNPRLPAERAAFVAQAWTEPAPDGGVRLRFDPAHRRVNPVLYRRDEAEACWRGVEAPVLYVVAAESGFLQRLGGEADPAHVATLVRRLEPCTIPHAGHMVHHEQPQLLAARVESFLRKLPSP